MAARGAGGVDGMADIEAIVVGGAPVARDPAVALVVEIAPAQADAAVEAGPAGRLRPGRPTARTWPGGSACWWPGADRVVRLVPATPARSVAAAVDGWRGHRWWPCPPTRCTGWPSTRPCPGPWTRLFALKGRPQDVALPVLVAGWRAGRAVAGHARAGGPSSGRPVLARAADPGGPAGRRFVGRPRRPAGGDGRRSGCGGPTIPWSGACAGGWARWR